jgi:predicted DNA-binding WGR domain protein
MSKVHLNKVGHYQGGTSDKVYIASIVPTTDKTGAPVYKVIGKYSRIYKNMTTTDKGQFRNINVAETERDKLFATKVKKGYVNIESPAYNGRLTEDTQWLLDNVEPDPLFNRDVFTDDGLRKWDDDEPEVIAVNVPASAINTSSDDEYDDFEVICLNASGMEELFDFDVTYIAEYHDTDKELLYVYDRFGEKQECLAERFAKVDETVIT